MERKLTLKLGMYLAAIIALVLWSGYSAQAAVVTVSEDTYVSNYGSYVNSNFGNSDLLVSGTWSDPDPMRIERTYLKFNLSSLAAGKIVTSATLYGYYYKDLSFSGGNPDLEHSLYVVGDYLINGTTPWTEGNLTWNNQSSAGHYLASWTPPANGKVWQSWAVTDAVKAEYLGDGTISIMIAGANEAEIKSAEEFLSKNFTPNATTYGASAGAFYLDITLADPQPPTPTPEPATLMLLGLGLMGLAGVRRKLKK